MSFKYILPGAWELTQDEQYELFSLHAPIAWQQVAKSLAQKRVKLLGKGYPSVPVYSLDRIISASFPRIVQTVRHGWQRPGVPWLLAAERAELFDLPGLIKDWLREEFSNYLGDDEVESIFDKLDDSAWQWEEEPTIYPLQLPAKNPYNIDIRFQAIPDYLAMKFLEKPQVIFGWDNQYQLTFYRVVSLNQGAELMSWPPSQVPLIKNQKSVGTANISFVINFKLQTVPWRNQPIIYHQLSIRRWITEPKESLPYRGVTAFIGDNRRWLDGKSQPFCFIPLAIKQTMTSQGREPRWPRAISELLKINDSPLPDPNTLASEPVYNWSAFAPDPIGIQAAIAYDTRYRGDVPCLPGVSPLDLASLDRAIQNLIEQENFPVRRVGEAVKKSGVYLPFWGTGKPQKKGSKELKNPDDLSTPMLRSKIAAPVTFSSSENSPNTILILWETKECRDALIAEICKLLLLLPKGEAKTYETIPGITGEETIYESPYGCLHIKTQHVLDLTQIFDVDNPSVAGNNRQQRRINLMDKRIHQIISYLPKPEGLSGALIEIKPKPLIPESDPKLALRIGVMQAGYVNQHIHALTNRKKNGEEYVTKDAPNRVQRAVSDLIRQFGILPAPLIDTEKDGIDPNMWLTCFHVLRRTRKTTANNKAFTVALMVRVNPVTGTVQVTTPYLFATQGWVVYPEALGYLLNEKWNPDSSADETSSDISNEQQSGDIRSEQQLLSKFVTDCLRDCLNTPIADEKLERVLFMAEAQNARQMLTWLRNPELPANDLPDEFKRHMTESEINRLLVVRLRFGGGGEVPLGIVKGSPGSRISKGGVFCWQDVCDDKETALYLSLRELLNTEQGTNTLQQKQSRLDNGKLQAGNPKPLEIAIIHHPGIERDQLACFVHNLRGRWPYFAHDVSLPFPFPLATLAKEYAVSARDVVEFVDLEDLEESAESVD
ncbi:hypothetical protein NIES37_68440 [Tolypothrix tenuis PCC 7101]|uniref:DUF3893 domain-containing protein n=1 Tax=Tolypothrix tenuis PCC 7101 TaxID=231146 RepID=A0A1Z4NAT8_9CYAN|nr:DUF3962 domain-containing protein [Aulosira sp. FACHB-113]BAZ02831.1 hypothetical protein NIES37_68440 [Tolypothrix tenuis PCC 7101]BAZ78275.1 hypothetical protein NIES50_69080 [Aulosira laxa NIES-50]